jgi:hypothetical protein
MEEEIPMKKTGLMILVMISLAAGLISFPVAAAVTPVPGTPGVPASTIYSLKVDGQTVFTGSELCNGNVTVEIGSFCMSGTVTVDVTVSSSFTSYEIRPRRHHIASARNGNTITFTLSQPLKLEIDVDSLNKLLLFATPVETSVPSPTDPNVIYFGPGTHQPGVIQPLSGQTIYIAPGALVKGRIQATQVNNVKVLGRGTLDARGYTSKANQIHGMLFNRCSNITVEGIALRSGEWWQSLYLLTDYVTVSHMNLLSFGVNNDGIDIDGTKHVRVSNCFIGCGDDGFGWHALDALTNGEPDTDDCIAEECVIWNTYAGNGLRVGASMETQNFQNITFRNIDVLRHNGSAIYSDHSDWAWCRNIRFENFTDESTSSTIGIKIAKTSYSNSNGYRDERGHYDGLYFINVTSPGGGISLSGFDAAHLIDNVYFENCYIGSNLIDTMSDITTNAYVTNIHFNQTPVPTPVTTPTPTPTPGGNLFSDDFEDGNSSGWTVASGSWSVVTDGTKVFKQTSTSGEAVVYAGNSTWTNYTVEAKVKLYNTGANTASGIITRYKDGSNYYLLRLHGSGKVQLYKKVAGTFTLLQEATQTGSANTWYTLKLVVSGSNLTGYVDGAQKVAVADSSVANGSIGARTYTQSAAIDNVVVY